MKWDAEKYDAVKAPQIDVGRELISLARVRETDDILDLGCGTGKLTRELAHLASRGSVTGLDPSPEMLEKAQTALADAGNVRFLQASAEDLDVRDRFDLVFSNSTMHWVQDQPRAAQAAHEALKSGGRIAFQFPAKDFCTEFFAAVESAVSDLGYERFFESWKSPWSFPQEADFASLLADAGFRSVEVCTREFRLLFGALKDLTDWWASAGLRPYLAALPETAQEYFLEAFGESFERNRKDEGIEFGFRRLFAFGKKE